MPRPPTMRPLPSARTWTACRDMAMKVEIRRVFNENFQVYGVRKVWRQLQREGFDVARCTVARLTRMMGLQGIIGGKPVKTTVSDKAAPCPLNRVNRQFRAPGPNMPWPSDFNYVTTWQGLVYEAFVIDAFARRIVGWRASRTAQARFVLDALDQALHDRRPVHRGGLIYHSDRACNTCRSSIPNGWQRLVSNLLSEASAIATTTLSPTRSTAFKRLRSSIAEDHGATSNPWEFATLEWVDWFNNRRLLEPIRNIPPAKAEATPCWTHQHWPHNLNQTVSSKAGAVQNKPSLNI